MGANNLLQRLKGEEGPVCAVRGKMVPHDGPDGQDDGCGDNNSHEGGPEQPHLLQVGRETDPSRKKLHFPKVFGIFPTSQLLPAKDDNFHNHNIILVDTVFFLIFSHYHHGYMTTTYI